MNVRIIVGSGIWAYLLFSCGGEAHRLGGSGTSDLIGIEGSEAGAGASSSPPPEDNAGGVASTPPAVGAGAPGEQPPETGVKYDTNPLPDDCEVPDWWADAGSHEGVLSFEPVEVYTGYVVSPRLPLPENDDTVTLYISARDDSTISGAIVFGSGAIPEPSTDPLNAYLPRERYDELYYPGYPGGSWDNLRPADVWNGYALSLREGTVEGSRLRFTVNASEQWRSWCELLAGYPNGLCVPSTDPDGFGGTTCGDVWSCEERCDIGAVRYDCGKFAMCAGGFLPIEEAYCACDGCGCSASTTAGRLSFDLHLEEDGEVNGQVEDGETSNLVYLTREP